MRAVGHAFLLYKFIHIITVNIINIILNILATEI